jgi:hypothetical protein
MTKFTRLAFALLVFALPVVVGCDQTEKTQVQEKVSDPGGTTTNTTTEKIDKTGDHKTP